MRGYHVTYPLFDMSISIQYHRDLLPAAVDMSQVKMRIPETRGGW